MNAFFNNEGEIKTFLKKQIERIHHKDIYTKGKTIGYSLGRKKMIPIRDVDSSESKEI